MARTAIGPNARLFVDANGAYSRKQALDLAERFADDARVSWFEEPVSSEDLEGLRLLRDRAPAGMEIAAGEYGDDAPYFRRMIEAGAVDVLQADVTRCGGITELLARRRAVPAHSLPLSLHCGPAIHLHPATALEQLVHLEYFHDHVRIEHMLFDGVVEPRDGALVPDLERPGNGLELKRSEAERHAALECSPSAPPDHHARAGGHPLVAQRPQRADAAHAGRGHRVQRAAARDSRSTSSTSGGRSATSGCGRRWRSRRR